MDISDAELLNILNSFNSTQVKYLLVGGFAVNFYGYNRTTADLDLWIMPSDQNKVNVLLAMEKLGYSKEELQDLSNEDFSKPVSFQIGANHFYVDVMTFISGVNFEEAYSLAIEQNIGSSVVIKIIHRNHLIVNKLLTGRTKDKLDVESLQEITKRKEQE